MSATASSTDASTATQMTSVRRVMAGRTGAWLTLAAVLVVDLALLLRRAFSSDISPFDEGYHLSHIQYLHDWKLPRVGDPMSPWSEQMYACHPTYPFGQVTGIPCGVDGPSEGYPEGGQNTAAGWPPLYYLVAAQLMRPLLAVGLEPVYAARSVSAVLWALGCVCVASLIISVGSHRVLALSAGIIGAAMPAAWTLGSFVTPHSSAMLVGSLILTLFLWSVSLPRSLPLVAMASVVVGVTAQGVLPHAIVAVAAVSLAALSLAWSHRVVRAQLLLMAGSLSVSALGTYLLWDRSVSIRTVTTVSNGAAQPSTPPEGVWTAVRDNWALFWPRGLREAPFIMGIEPQVALILAYGSVALAGHWLLSREASPQRAIALGVVIGVPVTSAAFAYLLDFEVPTRYGASAYALLLFLLALRSTTRIVRGAVLALCLITALVSLRSADSFMIFVPG